VFHETARFAFARILEAHWRQVYAEYRGIRSELTAWHERDLHDGGWQVFGLFDFPHGRAIEANIARCPFTASLAHEHVPRHGAVGFSVLAPGTRISAHRGYQGEFLRCHLGLQIPTGDCGLRMSDQVRRWATGRVLVFDDRAMHEAWNLTGEERVVLLIDFVPDGHPGSEGD
jgi:beta-hydroxylase